MDFECQHHMIVEEFITWLQEIILTPINALAQRVLVLAWQSIHPPAYDLGKKSPHYNASRPPPPLSKYPNMFNFIWTIIIGYSTTQNLLALAR